MDLDTIERRGERIAAADEKRTKDGQLAHTYSDGDGEDEERRLALVARLASLRLCDRDRCRAGTCKRKQKHAGVGPG